jgi:Ni,Fe-hydrogenase I large subunit
LGEIVDHIVTPWVTHKKALSKICAELIHEFLKSEINYNLSTEEIASKYSFKKFLKGEGSGYSIYKVINDEEVKPMEDKVEEVVEEKVVKKTTKKSTPKKTTTKKTISKGKKTDL